MDEDDVSGVEECVSVVEREGRREVELLEAPLTRRVLRRLSATVNKWRRNHGDAREKTRKKQKKGGKGKGEGKEERKMDEANEWEKGNGGEKSEKRNGEKEWARGKGERERERRKNADENQCRERERIRDASKTHQSPLDEPPPPAVDEFAA